MNQSKIFRCAATVAAISACLMAVSGCQSQSVAAKEDSSGAEEASSSPTKEKSPMPTEAATAKATFGSGCFWCTEAVFEELKGVKSAVSGYAGGHVKNPSYEAVCTGTTGHAECTQIEYDPRVVSYDELLEIFWRTHDPTTLNRQGNDVGPQYRSVIFYHNDEQRRAAEHYKKKLDESGAFEAPIVTEISPLGDFYPAEEHHQDYYERNPGQGYCAFVIRPKMEKFRKAFADKLK